VWLKVLLSLFRSVLGTGRSFKFPPDRKYSRVCLEQSPVVRTMMLYKRWKASQLDYPRVEVERTELANE
jgi:hypothetical protein